jgi:pseudaminic acid biosynthesis-associated methylase
LNLNSSNDQHNFWLGSFGDEYIQRTGSLEKLNSIYFNLTGTSLSKIFENFFSDFDKDMTILELGCNVGIKLEILKNMGFSNLTGLEMNPKALDIAKKNNPEINFINSSIEDFDPNGKTFDLVFTYGVLIHQHPSNIESIISKIIQLSKKFIFGYEYFSENLSEIKYRDHPGVMWKQNYSNLFEKSNSNLTILKEEKIPYKEKGLFDQAYLFEK